MRHCGHVGRPFSPRRMTRRWGRSVCRRPRWPPRGDQPVVERRPERGVARSAGKQCAKTNCLLTENGSSSRPGGESMSHGGDPRRYHGWQAMRGWRLAALQDAPPRSRRPTSGGCDRWSRLAAPRYRRRHLPGLCARPGSAPGGTAADSRTGGHDRAGLDVGQARGPRLGSDRRCSRRSSTWTGRGRSPCASVGGRKHGHGRLLYGRCGPSHRQIASRCPTMRS